MEYSCLIQGHQCTISMHLQFAYVLFSHRKEARREKCS